LVSPGPQKVLVVYGTRPEVIKMAPVVAALRRRPASFVVSVCATGQHRDMLDQAAELFGLAADADLDVMQPDQTLSGVAAAVLSALDGLLVEMAPDWLLVQGDTTTAMAATLAAFHRRVRVGHVEAGLRTSDLTRPFPEEANRRLVDTLAEALFAPTAGAAAALRAEGHDEQQVFLVGNTVVDALQQVAARVKPPTPGAPEVLVTMHRRESFGAPAAAVFAAVRELAQRFPEVRWIYPVHPNPRVRGPAAAALADLANVELHDPFDYGQLVRRLRACRFVLTDSGGLQEEAPSFGKPVLVLRDVTERPEGIAAGIARLVGTDRERIVAAASELLTSAAAYREMTAAGNPYGDGLAAERIAAILAGEPWTPFDPAAAARVAAAIG
jgi:UDP-N-acetylglucosamine 2-epimerase (non-hydrolysing)